MCKGVQLRSSLWPGPQGMVRIAEHSPHWAKALTSAFVLFCFWHGPPISTPILLLSSRQQELGQDNV